MVDAAAKHYDVPRITLDDRLKGRVINGCELGRPPDLTTDEDTSLVRIIEYQAQQRFIITRMQCMAFAFAMDQSRDRGERSFSYKGPQAATGGWD